MFYSAQWNQVLYRCPLDYSTVLYMMMVIYCEVSTTGKGFQDLQYGISLRLASTHYGTRQETKQNGLYTVVMYLL